MMCDNIQDCCRICLDVDSKHNSILEDLTVILHLKSCVAITVTPEDELPKSICVSCVSQLSEFYHFQLNARCSQDWLETAIQEKSKKVPEKMPVVQPLPDSEYNSDSLLEFLNNTANIEEYLNNLGKEDIPSIVNMLERNNENSLDTASRDLSITKQQTPKKKQSTVKQINCKMNMEIDVLDSDVHIVKEILEKETNPKKKYSNIQTNSDNSQYVCFACKMKLDNFQKLSEHLSTCDSALRTCLHCNVLFDSKRKMLQHSIIHNHNSSCLICNCGKQFSSKEKLTQHHNICHIDYATAMGYVYRCKQCKETFSERFQLYKHAKEHVLIAEKRICNVCGHHFIGNDALSKHRTEVHKILDETKYRCKVCHKIMFDHKEMFLHVQQHTVKPEPDRHLCESCGKSFTTCAILLRHLQQHEKTGHWCGVCGVIFRDLKARDKHVMEHVEMVMCERCGRTVSSCELGLGGHCCT